MSAGNFGAFLLDRCAPTARLVDAPGAEEISDLPTAIRRAAGGLRAHLSPGDRVVLWCRHRPAGALAYLGAMFAGLVPVPLEENLSEERVLEVARTTSATALWTDRRKPPGEAVTDVLRVLPGDVLTGEPLATPAPVVAGDLAALMMTSGSTAHPRFVRVTHGNLIVNTEDIVATQGLGERPDEVAMLVLPVAYCFGASVLHSHLAVGGSVVWDSRFMFPDRVLEAADQHRCTTFAGVPSVYRILLRRSHFGQLPLTGLRRFLQAGGPLSPADIQEIRSRYPGADFHVMYGQTEATARLTSLAPGRLEAKLGSVGPALPRVELSVRGDDGSPLAPGEIGTVHVRGPSVCPGYLDGVELAADEWLDTGDHGYLDQDRDLWITGRHADFLKVRGVRLGFDELEDAVRQVPGVGDVAVCSLEHPEAGEVPGVIFIPEPWEAGPEIAAAILAALPRRWTCEQAVPVRTLPLTVRGKVDRARVADLVQGVDRDRA